MALLIVHPAGAAPTSEFTRLVSSHALSDDVVVLSTVSEASFEDHRSAYRDLPDVHVDYSIEHAEAAARRAARAFASTALAPLGVEATILGRVGDPLGVAAAVAKAYDVDALYFTDSQSRLRRWYRRWRLTRLGFDGVVYQHSPGTTPPLPVDAEGMP